VRRPRQSWGRRTIALGFVAAAVIGALTYFAPVLIAAQQQTGQRDSLSNNSVPAPNSPFTVLLLGSDDDAKFDRKHLLTQSMILVRVDPVAKQATLLSIPRDLWVPISSTRNKGKIMTAFSTGGARSAITTVERNFHVRVDDYVWIGLRGLIKLIDAWVASM
jgi:anionic cell wall polymer biosynthesis LytR-Cps2A-Psr (LCP) family protein